MKQRILLVVFALLLGLAVGSMSKCSTLHANGAERFFITDISRIGRDSGYTVAYMLHDRKGNEVCFLVVEGATYGVAMTPRGC